MPLAANYGFIFNFETRDLDLLAHELAHGAFNLRHTFSDKAQHYLPQNQTRNLMDYAGGVELWKYQWDLIHNPEKILFSWSQDESEGAAIALGKIIVFDEPYNSCQYKILTFEGADYKVPYPWDKNIKKAADKNSAFYYFVDYDLDLKIKKETFVKRNPFLPNEYIEEHLDGLKSISSATSYCINSPFTISAITNNHIRVIEILPSQIESYFDSWGNKHWNFRGVLLNNKKSRQLFAIESLKGGALDIRRYFNVQDEVLYSIDNSVFWNEKSGNTKYYCGDELIYWCYGYYLAKMNFSGSQAVALTMQYFNKEKVLTFNQENRIEELPWRISAMLDGFYSFRQDPREKTPFIDMYSVYDRTPGIYEFDIEYDLNDFTIDAVFIIATGTGYGIGKTVVQTGVKFTVGAMIDITLQMALLTLGGTSVEDAYDFIDWRSAVYSGVETFHSSWLQASTMTCLNMAFLEMGGMRYDYETVIFDCGQAFLTNFLANRLLKSRCRYSRLIERSLNNDAEATVKRLYSLGLDKDLVEWILAKVGVNLGNLVNEIYEKEF
ncbi:hypothetical protein SAMN03080601_01488 [Alkalitalea saponilacus]|uniref:Uncharacterized protein n=2 Tax=Alkalitalea saponilacus TaxID=889453 RepID=A0A1T5F5P1_9BACT|nr:hypothetical protein SAMN03080601_01488 [Alkalitalea saponilacus]